MIKTLLVKFPDCLRRTQFLCVSVVLLLLAAGGLSQAEDVLSSLVGRWDFDDGTGKDLSGNGNAAVLEGGTVYSLGEGQACIQFMPGAKADLVYDDVEKKIKLTNFRP